MMVTEQKISHFVKIWKPLVKDIFQRVKNFFWNMTYRSKLLILCLLTVPLLCWEIFFLFSQDNPHFQGTHCFLYRHDLHSKTLPSKLKIFIDSSVKTINWIKVCALNYRLLMLLCQDYVSEYSVSLFNTEVHWLSSVRALMCFFELWKEVKAFLNDRYYDNVKKM